MGIRVKFADFVKCSQTLMDLESYSGKLPEDYEFDLAKYCVADLYGREMLMCSLIKLPLLLKQLSGEIDFGLYSTKSSCANAAMRQWSSTLMSTMICSWSKLATILLHS